MSSDHKVVVVAIIAILCLLLFLIGCMAWGTWQSSARQDGLIRTCLTQGGNPRVEYGVMKSCER